MNSSEKVNIPSASVDVPLLVLIIILAWDNPLPLFSSITNPEMLSLFIAWVACRTLKIIIIIYINMFL